MKRNPEDILKDALELPPEARAAIAGTLINSLDDEVDERAEPAWEAEIARRVEELDAGKVQGIPWSVVRRRLAGR
jgi:putative addiction module component (TIGR02574 family)